MDDKLKKAFETANYMATLSNQRRIILEELNQKLVYYVSGGTFLINLELINYTKIVLDLGQSVDVVFLDKNNLPVVISDVQKFFDDIVTTYFESVNDYYLKFNEIKAKRNVEGMVSL